MKEKPVLFSAPMVRTLLNCTKSQTRRVVKPQPHDPAGGIYAAPSMIHGSGSYTQDHLLAEGFDGGTCPYGQPGDRLWVREAWQHSNHPYGPADESCAIFYRADYWDDPHGMDGENSPEGKYREWRPSIHMPRWASRILLEIAGIRIERLQDISVADVRAEGVSQCPDWHALADYHALWESIYGPGSWDANPWVWVIEFKRVEP